MQIGIRGLKQRAFVENHSTGPAQRSIVGNSRLMQKLRTFFLVECRKSDGEISRGCYKISSENPGEKIEAKNRLKS